MQQFPSWAPVGVVELWRARVRLEEVSGPELAGGADVLERLMTDARMQWVWSRLAALAQKKGLSTDDTQARFAGEAMAAFAEPDDKLERMTRAEYERWVGEVAKTAAHLAELIQGTGLDLYHWRDRFDPDSDDDFRLILDRFLKGSGHAGKFQGPLFHELLSRLETEVHAAERAGRFNLRSDYSWAPRPNAPHARRARFVRVLTEFCRDEFGSPYRKIVRETTSVAFQEAIDERVITRLAP